MDDCNIHFTERLYIQKVVQIPLWTIVTHCIFLLQLQLISSDSSMDDCNGILLSL